jgi:Cof subfamily protein (haloacid dehalogenase superfamily)
MEHREICLFISDVDGTVLNPQKELSPATIKAVQRLQSAGIHFSLVSNRPPKGLEWIIEALDVRGACAALNGGVIIVRDSTLTILSERSLRPAVAQEIIGTIERYALDPWIYTRAEWYVSRIDGPHVRHDAESAQLSPHQFETLGDISEPVIKIMGVSDNYAQVSACEDELRRHFADQLSVSRSLSNRLDITHRDANKGAAADAIAGVLGVSMEHVATAGDSETDISMFRRSAMSIAMGQASAEVHRAATHTTVSNAQDGIAWAIEELILKEHVH